VVAPDVRGLHAVETSFMTAWIVLCALTALVALALRWGRPDQPRLPAGYDGERQLAELRALVTSSATD